MLKLTSKQKRFADEYIKSLNATDAYRKAGYKAKTKNATYAGASQILSYPKVQDYIQKRNELLDKKDIADQEEIQKFFTDGMRGIRKEKILIGVGNGKQKVIEQPISEKDRVRNANMLAKSKGMFLDRQQIEFKPPIFIDDVPEDDDNADS